MPCAEESEEKGKRKERQVCPEYQGGQENPRSYEPQANEQERIGNQLWFEENFFGRTARFDMLAEEQLPSTHDLFLLYEDTLGDPVFGRTADLNIWREEQLRSFQDNFDFVFYEDTFENPWISTQNQDIGWPDRFEETKNATIVEDEFEMLYDNEWEKKTFEVVPKKTMKSSFKNLIMKTLKKARKILKQEILSKEEGFIEDEQWKKREFKVMQKKVVKQQKKNFFGTKNKEKRAFQMVQQKTFHVRR